VNEIKRPDNEGRTAFGGANDCIKLKGRKEMKEKVKRRSRDVEKRMETRKRIEGGE